MPTKNWVEEDLSKFPWEKEEQKQNKKQKRGSGGGGGGGEKTLKR